jgi:hypothetical protein
MVTTPFSDMQSGLRSLGVAWADDRYGLGNRLMRIARNAPDAHTAELSVQELLLHFACRNPISGAARLIDGPLAPLVGADLQKEVS